MSDAGAVRWIALGVLISAIGAAFLLRHQFDVGDFRAAIAELGVSAPIGFVAAFAAGAVLFLPGAIFGIAGGALFGPIWGAVLNVVGGTVGAALAFLIARYVAGDWVRRRLGGRLGEIAKGVEAEGWRFVAFVRLVPLFPFNASNYALGLTRISLWQYVAATAICMTPGSAAYAWLGHAGVSAAAGTTEAIWYGSLGLAALAAIAFLPRLLKRIPLDAGAKVHWIEAGEVAALLPARDGALIVDVREGDEFAGSLGHIPGAANIPLARIVADPNQLAEHKTRLVVLVCKTDRRSARAQDVLARAGFRAVSVLRGGMERWKMLGLPIARETSVATDASAVHSE